jgi:hypothetical protein
MMINTDTSRKQGEACTVAAILRLFTLYYIGSPFLFVMIDMT